MRKHPLLIALLSTALMGGLPAHADDPAPLVVVNGKTLTEQDYQELAELLKKQSGGRDVGEEQRSALIQDMIHRELVVQDALKQELEKTPQFAAKLEKVRQNLLIESAVRNYVDKNPLSDEALKKEYDARVAQIKLPKEYKAKHILVEAEDEAKALIESLKKGEDFAKIAKEKSQDKVSAAQGGDLGWFDVGQMVKPFGDAIATMEKGKISETPVKSDFGWHVILLEDSREGTPPAFDEIKDNLKTDMQKKQVKEYLENLKKDAKIELKEPAAVKAEKSEEAAKPEEAKPEDAAKPAN